jgi:hypothetical protein
MEESTPSRFPEQPRPVERMMSSIRRLVFFGALGAAIATIQACASGRVAPEPKQQGSPRAAASGIPENCCDALERDIVEELNRARTDPRRYATSLEGDLRFYRGNLFRRPTDESALQTREGTAAVLEAIESLRKTKPLGALRSSSELTKSARDHVRGQAPRGLMNHKGTDGTMAWDRVSKYGRWETKVSENMTFGPATGRDVIAALIIDDGIKDRGHRRNIFDPEIKIVGVSCAPHKTYRLMCDIVHAGGLSEDRQ